MLHEKRKNLQNQVADEPAMEWFALALNLFEKCAEASHAPTENFKALDLIDQIFLLTEQSQKAKACCVVDYHLGSVCLGHVV